MEDNAKKAFLDDFIHHGFQAAAPQFPKCCMLHVQNPNVQGNCQNEVYSF